MLVQNLIIQDSVFSIVSEMRKIEREVENYVQAVFCKDFKTVN